MSKFSSFPNFEPYLPAFENVDLRAVRKGEAGYERDDLVTVFCREG